MGLNYSKPGTSCQPGTWYAIWLTIQSFEMQASQVSAERVLSRLQDEATSWIRAGAKGLEDLVGTNVAHLVVC